MHRQGLALSVGQGLAHTGHPVQWQQQRGGRNVVKAYAFPGYPPVADIEGQQLWEHCIDITAHILPTGELEITLAGSY